MKLLSFGEIIWDVYPDKKCIGGAPLNFAAHAKRAGAESYLLSAVGDDSLGEEALAAVARYGVKTDYVSMLSGISTGQCRVSLDSSGVPSYDILSNVAYDHISPEKALFQTHFDALVFGTLALRGENNRSAIKKLLSEGDFGEIFVDLNLRAPFYDRESILIGLENATMLKVSDEELPQVLNIALGCTCNPTDGVRMLAEEFPGIHTIVLTCGGDGSAAYDCRTGAFVRCEAVPTEVVSTVGAGDSYGATFLAGYLSGKSIEECLAEASRVSAFVVSGAEAIPED